MSKETHKWHAVSGRLDTSRKQVVHCSNRGCHTVGELDEQGNFTSTEKTEVECQCRAGHPKVDCWCEHQGHVLKADIVVCDACDSSD